MLISLSTSRCNVCPLAAWVSTSSIISFRVRSFRRWLCRGSIVLNLSSTGLTSQVSLYLGVDALRLNMPLINLLTSGWFPAAHPSTTIPNKDRALLAVLTQLYSTPLWKIADKKFMMSPTEGVMGLMSHLLQNCVHLLMWGRYCFSVSGRHEAKMMSAPSSDMPWLHRCFRTIDTPSLWCVAWWDGSPLTRVVTGCPSASLWAWGLGQASWVGFPSMAGMSRREPPAILWPSPPTYSVGI